MFNFQVPASALIWIVLTTATVQADDILIQPPRSAADASHSYYEDLLKTLHPENRSIVRLERTVTQDRGLELLATGDMTIAWCGTTSLRENQYRPVRVPLFAGLLGIRVPVIRKADKTRFEAIQREEELQALVACQGDQWPDSNILERNGYKVERVAQFDHMYRMLKGGRCDYFPRSVTEVYGELETGNKDDLMAYEGILLSYPFPMYFFTTQKEETLAAILEQRLYEFAKSGKLLNYMKAHPSTRQAFPLSRFKNASVFYLNNPDLPTETPLGDSALWLMPMEAVKPGPQHAFSPSSD